MKRSAILLPLAAALALAPSPSGAEDVLKVVIAQRGNFDTSISELGQRAGIFRKHGLTLDIDYPARIRSISEAIGAGRADIAVAPPLPLVLRQFLAGDPTRIIRAHTFGANDYWYALGTARIRSLKDAEGKRVAYLGDGTSTHDMLRGLMQQYGVGASLVPVRSPAESFEKVMAGEIDIGWSAPPFGVEALEQGKIRVVARANDNLDIRRQTIRTIVANAETLRTRRSAVTRFLRAYGEAVNWVYAGRDALKLYAELAGISQSMAARVRDDFYTKDMFAAEDIVGLDAMIESTVKAGGLDAPPTKEQLAELIQIAPLSLR